MPTTPAYPNFHSRAPVYALMGKMETRLARTREEVLAAQSLRFEVFHQELGANFCDPAAEDGLDADRYDDHCDHLIVLDEDRIVGTYRMMLKSRAEAGIGFYSQTEFDLSSFLKTNNDLQIMELGRSCILPAYRSKRTMELLWAGTWAYAVKHGVDVMFGCVSLPTTDCQEIADVLAWLGENAQVDSDENCAGIGGNTVDLNRFRCSSDSRSSSARSIFAKMPPLLKGYLRLGAKVGTTAVIDHQFGTIDLLLVLKVASINPRYISHFKPDASRFAA